MRVKRNKGVAGIDDMTVNKLLPYLRENKKDLIASLQEGSYKSSSVKRVKISKPNGGKHKIGIPNGSRSDDPTSGTSINAHLFDGK